MQLISDKEFSGMKNSKTGSSFLPPTTNHRLLRSAPYALSLLTSLWATPSQAVAHSELGRLHDAASWRSEEFKLNWGLSAIGADAAYARGLSGNGVRLAIGDTGVDLRHSEFSAKNNRPVRLADPGCEKETLPTKSNAGCFFSEGDRASIEYNDLPPDTLNLLEQMVADGELPIDELEDYEDIVGTSYEPHGTHVAGTMLANRDGKGMHGVAWAADASPIGLFSNFYSDAPESLERDKTVSPSYESYLRAYKQLREQHVRIINHSWGIPQTLTTVEQLDAALQTRRAGLGGIFGKMSLDGGLLQVWAAGNSRNNPSPEAAPFADSMATLPRVMPELEPYWLSVVNVDENLRLGSNSSRCGYSMNWCVAAPGTRITSTVVEAEIDVKNRYDEEGEVNGFDVLADRPTFDYASTTGTSMAAPHASGALGLLMERFPYLSNPQLRDVLLTTAQDLGAPGVDEIYGWGLIDLKKAIDGPGQLRVDTTVAMNRRAGGAVVWQGSAWDDWHNDISGPGRLGKSGDGWLRLSGNNSFAGATLNGGILELDGNNRLTRDINVAGGLLRLNGSLHGTDLNVNGGLAQINGLQTDAMTRVGTNGWLTGDGTLADTQVLGTIAPGSEHRALIINGDYLQGAGSTLIASAGEKPDTAALQITGQARVEASTLRLARKPDVFTLGKYYPVLQADAGVTGQFTTLDHRAFSPFLSFIQTRDAHSIGVDVGRGLPLLSAANATNQRATARAADALAISEPLAQRLTSLFPAEARNALGQLSGELHASTQAVQIENTRVLRDAALARARGALDSPARQTGNSRQGVWVQSLLQSGRLDGNGNAASANHKLTGLMVGADHDFEQGTRAGVLLASGQVNVKTAGSDQASLDGYQFGIHAGHTWNGFGLYGGLAWGQNRIKTSRYIRFPGVEERLSADYRSRTQQAFVEGNYHLLQGAWDWQPFVQFARVNAQTDGFRERGARSALKGRAASSAVNLATGGLRFKVDLNRTSIGPSWLSLNGSAAYTRASGDLSPTTDVAWQEASTMRIASAPLNNSALQLNLGAVARLNRSSTVSLNLNDQRGERSNARSASIQYQFEF